MRVVRPLSFLSATLAAIALAAPAAHAVPTYTFYYLDITPLGPNPAPPTSPPGPNDQVVGIAINSSAQTVGCVEDGGATSRCDEFALDGNAQAYRSNLGTVAPVTPFPGNQSYGRAINNAGEIAGWGYTGAVDSGFFVYNAFRDTTPLPPSTAGYVNSLGRDINASGQVTGYVSTADDSSQHAFRATGTSVLDLQTLTGGLGGTQSSGWAINDTGTVTGWATDAAGARRAMKQTGPLVTDLMVSLHPTVGAAAAKTSSVGHLINASGTVAGCAYSTGIDCDTDTRAFIAKVGGASKDLDPTSAYTNTVVNGINSLNVVVGSAQKASGEWVAFWYDAEAAIPLINEIPLLPANPELTDPLVEAAAMAINDAGWVVGYEEHGLGGPEVNYRHGFLFNIFTSELIDIDAMLLSLVPGLDSDWMDWRFTQGHDISETGAILAYCRNGPALNEPLRACLLVPTPEPASFASFAAGLAALGILAAFAARRRRHGVRT